MIGIFLTLLAALLVICLAFCYSDHGHASRHSGGDLSYLNRSQKRKS